ncbi:hypothetical protein L6164_026630 [Bauhinia variegata]|uniref:Uncharacterized protein n=1 Tax=Bauhinia variegata TaxID=167791 RepID=A0ACB9LR27_BAUVA|nr:hypothetical protein L6164_026630 [Bauhinia variegata]
MVGLDILSKENNTDWLYTLLHSSFRKCKDHRDLKNSEKNVFCIDCTLRLCRHCKEAHSLHRTLQIYRYVYQDVIRLSDLQKHFDCSKIQTYISNNERIIHLNPRPALHDTNPSKRSKYGDRSPESQFKVTKLLTRSKSGGACEECGRNLQDERNLFCSIACKISVVSVEPQGNQNSESTLRGPTNQSAKLISTQKPEISGLYLNDDNQNSETESSISVAEPDDRFELVNFRKRARKGLPQRSPFLCIS